MDLFGWLILVAAVAVVIAVVRRRSPRRTTPRTEHDHATAARVNEAKAMTQIHQQNNHLGGPF